METFYTLERKIQHCKSCSAKCDMDSPIVGCESIMAPGHFELMGNVYTACCVKRTWFDKNYFPVDLWDSTKITDNMSPEEFWQLMAEELKKAQAKAIKI